MEELPEMQDDLRKNRDILTEDEPEPKDRDIPGEDESEPKDRDIPEKEEPVRKEANRWLGSFGRGFAAGVLTVLLLASAFLAGWRLAEQNAEKQGQEKEERGAEVLTAPETLRKLDEVQSLIEEHYLDEVDSEMLVSYLFKGIAVGLDDVYANYYSEQELTSVMDENRGMYTGIGAVMSQDTETNKITVQAVYEGMPADLAGMQAGDIVLAVDDSDTTDMKLDDLVALVKGNEGTFQIRVYRPKTDEELTLEIVTGDVEIPAVSYELKEDGIGYIRIQEFTESAVDQFQAAAKDLTEQGASALIVDLRDNPGGLLTAVCDILDEILPGKLMVYMEDRAGNREEYYADRKRTVDCEVAVLVNGNSASASEIFAGAIQDYEIGPVIGTTTYGKGVVQKTFGLSDGSAFKMTVEKYYTPLGQDIDGNGITPDIVVEEPKEAEVSDTAEAADAEEVSDPVLEKAVEVLRGDLKTDRNSRIE